MTDEEIDRMVEDATIRPLKHPPALVSMRLLAHIAKKLNNVEFLLTEMHSLEWRKVQE